MVARMKPMKSVPRTAYTSAPPYYRRLIKHINIPIVFNIAHQSRPGKSTSPFLNSDREMGEKSGILGFGTSALLDNKRAAFPNSQSCLSVSILGQLFHTGNGKAIIWSVRSQSCLHRCEQGGR